MMARAIDLVTGLATSRSYWLLALAAALVIGPTVIPVSWSGNEVVYFDLAYRSVVPDAFTDAHAMFDSSKSRIVALMSIGYVIKLLGFEAAKTVLALLTWALYAAGLAAIARGLGLRVVELSVALLIFLLAGQELVGDEWIFRTVEPKVLAYIFVFFAFAAALGRRWGWMVALGVVATYFHFLVGGAWTVLFLALYAMERPRPAEVARLLGAYVVLTLPILWLLVSEQLGTQVDTSGLGGTIDQIYATFAAPFHVAPFAEGLAEFGTDWLPGFIMHVALAVVLGLAAVGQEGRDRLLFLWCAGLNLLLPLAAVAAWIDSDTHHIAKFLIFRPSALVLLLSCLLLVRRHFPSPERDVTRLAPASVLLVSAILLPGYLQSIGLMIVWAPPSARLEAQMSGPERDVMAWILQETNKDAAILVEPDMPGMRNNLGKVFPLGLERLTGRGLIVDYKNVPSDPRDFVRWYDLLRAREAFFQGDCGQLAILGADVVVFRSRESQERLSACTDLVHSTPGFLVTRTRNLPG
jgi:hypothetical protein